MDHPGVRRLLVLILALALGAPAHAFAAPAASGTTAQAAQAQAEMRKMQGELSAGVASYAKVSGSLAATRREIDANGKRLRVLERMLASANPRPWLT